MKHVLFSVALVLTARLGFGQGSAAEYADDAFRYSNFNQTGTARFRGLGGNQTALGGDASNVFGNPAGLGFYNRSELSISPSVNLTSNKSSYLGSTSTATNSNVNIAQFGVIFAGRGNTTNTTLRRSNFGISYSQSVNFSEQVLASGTNRNTNSSIVQQYINGANTSNNGRGDSAGELNAAYDPSTGQADFIEAAAYQLYLINPTDLGTQGSGPPYTRLDANVPLSQQAVINRTGAHSQWTLAYAGNFNDKFYVGGSLAITHLKYTSDFTLRETPIGGVAYNNYGQNNLLNVTGNGIGLSLGAIYKIDPSFQVGATFISPTFSGVHETFDQSLFAFPRDPALIAKYNSPNPHIPNTISVPSNDFDYTLTTPLRASAGATYFIGDGKVGFLTATAEYVGYSGMRIGTSAYSNTQDNQAFHDDVKYNVQQTYQNVVNFRAGAEFRAGLLRLRAGAAYMPSAYKIDLDRVPKSDRSMVQLSAGLGVRNQRFFADASGSYMATKTGFSPYTLPSDADTPTVATTQNRTNVTLSFGVFF